MESLLFNAIIKWFDDNGNYKRIDDIEWINYVCEETGMTVDQYKKLMQIDLLDGVAKSVEAKPNGQ